jgi:hypothetical protein
MLVPSFLTVIFGYLRFGDENTRDGKNGVKKMTTNSTALKCAFYVFAKVLK